MIAVVDYDVGNIRSVLFALRRLQRDAELTDNPSLLQDADGLILPGVGAFAPAMDQLRERGLDDVVCQFADSGRPLLGICLGHQLLFSESEEHGLHEGLNLLPGQVVRFERGLKVPHMGWNQVDQTAACSLFEDIESGEFFYFAHSYYTLPAESEVSVGSTDYGRTFTSVASRDNVFGAQFHPEKSGAVGLKMLSNFCRLCEED